MKLMGNSVRVGMVQQTGTTKKTTVIPSDLGVIALLRLLKIVPGAITFITCPSTSVQTNNQHCSHRVMSDYKGKQKLSADCKQ